MAYKDLEKKRKWEKEYRKKNREKLAKREKAWREKNPDKVKAQKKRYAERNREYIRQKSHDYYHNIAKHRHKKDPTYKEKVRERNQRKIAKWRNFLQEQRMKLGGKCTECGYNKELRVLQFHHINPKDKYKDVPMIRNKKKALEEIKKCTLLCPTCHAVLHLNHA